LLTAATYFTKNLVESPSPLVIIERNMNYKKIRNLFYTFAFFDEFILIYPLYAIMFADRGLSPAQISSLFIVWSLTAFLLEVPSGSVADKYSRKNVLFFATLIRAFGFLIWLLLPSYWGFLLGFVLWGISSAFTSGTLEALVYDELKRVGKTSAYTKVVGRIEALAISGTILGGFAAALLADYGYEPVLVLSIAAVLLSSIPVYLLPKANPVESTGEVKYLDYLREGVEIVLKNTKLLFIIIFAAIMTGLGAVDEYYNLFFDEKGFSNQWIAIAISIVFLFGAAGSMLAYKLAEKKSL
jgi:MFS family permease